LLASDNDREGEAIAYHIGVALGLEGGKPPVERIAFDEITPQAIRDAVLAPRGIDEARVAAQKARRVLDRLVGYNLSPLLWKKVKNGLSAGRVQSVALRLICEREKEVESFIPEESWGLEARLRKGRGGFGAELLSLGDAAIAPRSEAEAAAAAAALEAALAAAGGRALVAELVESERLAWPEPPFTTSTLLQAAAERLGFTGKKTMQVAQQLYEGVALGEERIGLVTYLRSDSTRVSALAAEEARAYIRERYPAELPPRPNEYAVEGKSQDAHEAIRPTMVGYHPDMLRERLSKDQHKLYALVWERFLASQMIPAKFRQSRADISLGEARFRSTSARLVEQGFYKVLKLGVSKEERAAAGAPELRAGEPLKVEGFLAQQRFSRGPERYTEASIIKALDEEGIGRPSTYAPIISVLLERYYVTREDRRLAPTTLGRMIGDILAESFPELLDPGFTAGMEGRLDEVEEGKADWLALIRDFYGPFKVRVDEVMERLEPCRGSLDEATDELCGKCGKPMVKKLGRFGFFLACSGFPECRSTRSLALATCPRCGGDIVARRKASGRGREFYGCSRYPECGFVTYAKPSSSSCPKCGWFLVEKRGKKTGPHKACINPDCDYLHDRGCEARAAGTGGSRG
ncbi:MAG TPA: type I DNA topoisomerase, partial [Spirochaetia bacterium]|nr:type I DNA topoisomerase [Spirochaetia bacterium]